MSFYERFKYFSSKTVSYMGTIFGIPSLTIGLILYRYFEGPLIKRRKRDRAAEYGETLYQLEIQNKDKENVTLESQ